MEKNHPKKGRIVYSKSNKVLRLNFRTLMQKSWPPIHYWQIKTGKEELPWVLRWVFLFRDFWFNHALCDQDPCPFIAILCEFQVPSFSITGISGGPTPKKTTFPPRKFLQPSWGLTNQGDDCGIALGAPLDFHDFFGWNMRKSKDLFISFPLWHVMKTYCWWFRNPASPGMYKTA